MRKVIVLFIVLLGCQTDEADFPEVRTQDALQIGSTGVLMGGEIKEIGPVKPVYFGFFWDTQSNLTSLTSANKYIGGTTSDPRVYSIQLSNLFPATKYYYRAFAANADYSKVYYGGIVSFTTLP